MAENKDQANKFETLRQQAEALIRNQTGVIPETPPDILDLIHELRIHQAELEIQNEELQRAQQEISDLHKEYENLYEFAPCGYLTLNHKGIITHLNLTGNRLLDTQRNHVSRVGFSQFIDLGWNDAYFSARSKSAETGRKQSIELPIKRKNDPPLWVQAEIQADRNEADEVLQWRIVLLDISEKKQAVAALEKSEARYRKMMESISDPLYVCSPDQRVEFINPAMIERLGRDATGEICYQAIHDLEETCNWCPFDKVRNGETIEENIVSPLDNRNYRATHMPILNDDQSVSKLTIYRDITDFLMALEEKEKAQDRLQQAQKMESIGNLAGGVAHDFNNILSSVIGFAELALDDVEPGSALEDNLHEIYTAGIRAKDIVMQILTFARKTDEKVKPVSIDKIAKDSLSLLRSSIPTDIEIVQNINTDALVVGNPSLLQQVLLNLSKNAADAMEDDGGRLGITVSDVAFDGKAASDHDLLGPGDYVQITVSDTGVGIPQDSIQSVFEPYYTTKGLGKGTGLGLATVHGTVKKYGGAIHVESRLGEGTSFTVLLPATKKREATKPYLPEALPKGNERILFVDDELPIVKMCSLLLERLGYSVTARTSSIEALELFQTKPDDFDLVITDMTMPDLTGDKLAVELMKIRRDIPVILCTGYSKKISDDTASEIGIKAFAYKPMATADLAKAIRKVLDEAKG